MNEREHVPQEVKEARITESGESQPQQGNSEEDSELEPQPVVLPTTATINDLKTAISELPNWEQFWEELRDESPTGSGELFRILDEEGIRDQRALEVLPGYLHNLPFIQFSNESEVAAPSPEETSNLNNQEASPGSLSSQDYLRAIKTQKWPRVSHTRPQEKLQVMLDMMELTGINPERITEVPEEIERAGVGANIRSEHFEQGYQIYRLTLPGGHLYACPTGELHYRYDIYINGELQREMGLVSRGDLAQKIASLLN